MGEELTNLVADLIDAHKPCCGDPPACDECLRVNSEGCCVTYLRLLAVDDDGA